MTAHFASLINALALIGLSLWAYLAIDMASSTALIPAAFGVALLLCNSGVKAQNKIIAPIALLLTVIVFAALLTPLKGALARGDELAVLRVSAMLLTTAFALVIFIKSFIVARRGGS